jgi:hypothetical protein
MERLTSSFRDPAGFMFRHAGKLYRRIEHSYAGAYDQLMGSGLYDVLSQEGLLVAHREVRLENGVTPGAYQVLEPEEVSFLSYPYEWCFSQLRDAALVTLEVQKRAIEHGMLLKDASAFNIQFIRGRPVLIDTLSFEIYDEGEPWVAYRQFCQHFLAPLLLMSRVDVRLGKLLQVHLDGVPIDLTARLLPRRTVLSPGTLLHVHLHARSLRRHAATALRHLRRPPRLGRTGLLGLVDNLESTIRSLSWRPDCIAWSAYPETHTYLPDALHAKRAFVTDFLTSLHPSPVLIWDLGANTGEFSRLAAEHAGLVVAFDGDPAAVERNYRRVRAEDAGNVLPLLMDLTNPTPGVGWRGVERDPWLQRRHPDVVLALALVHHLAIANNLPFAAIAALLAEIAPAALVEFVPKSDPQVQRLLGSRRDVFSGYDKPGFEDAFAKHFQFARSEALPSSERTLYLLKRW